MSRKKGAENESSSETCLRLHSSDGQRSTRMECDEQTTCADICQHFSCDCVTLQIGNYQFRQLKPETSPLVILQDFCRILSMSEDSTSTDTGQIILDDIMSYTDSPSFRHIFSFFLGRPRIRAKSTMNSGILSEEVLVRKGKIIHSWMNAKSVFYNSTIRIQTRQHQDEILHLRNMKADVYESKKGKALRLRDDENNQYFLLIFQRPNILQLWLSKAQQVEKSSHVDASDEQLTMIPEQLLNNDYRIQVLNLRRNSLISRPSFDKTVTPLGYVDDLYRIHSLQVVDLSANQISSFPLQIAHLTQLRQLNLSSNFIPQIPKQVGNMRKLQYLNLANNLLSAIPEDISNCTSLITLDLSFNQFSQIPICLCHLNIDMWKLAGNNIEKLEMVGNIAVQKIDLRRNILATSFRFDLENVTHLDIRDNSLTSTVHLTNLRFLKVIHCERLQLTSLHLSGESLTHVYADHNLLESIVIMPLPENLQTLSLSHNHFRTLPDWISDCQKLAFLKVNNNHLEKLPDRIFCSTSLRCLFAFENKIEQLPNDFEENCLETLILYKNAITELPKRFFAEMLKLKQLNISSNSIEILPYIDNLSYCRLQIFRAANNCLTENSVPMLISMKHLKTLDLSHNFLNSFDDSALTSLELLEEINLSSNRLTRLSDCLGTLPSLQTLRAHSNQLVYVPQFQNCNQLNTIDVSSNNISLGNLEFKAPSSLRHFDITCNSGDFVTENAFDSKMNTINIADAQQNLSDFQIGVSGSRGSKNKQCIRQIRVDNTFAFIDGGSNYYMSSSICRFLSQHLRENENSDIRSVLLRCHCELGEEGERLGASVLIIRITGKVIEVASTGTISAAISSKQNLHFLVNGRYDIDDDEYSRIREAHGFVDEENRINGIIKTSRQLGHFSMFPIVLPTHSYKKFNFVEKEIDGIIVANSSVWQMISLEDISQIFQNNRSPIAVAKKLQDRLQSYDYCGNSNILVFRRIKPQMTFAENIEKAIPAIVTSEQFPIPAIRYISSPSPPPLPKSIPPEFHEEIMIASSSSNATTTSNFAMSIDRYYGTISRQRFDETRDLLSKSLKLSPPSTVTFNI